MLIKISKGRDHSRMQNAADETTQHAGVVVAVFYLELVGCPICMTTWQDSKIHKILYLWVPKIDKSEMELSLSS